MLLTLLLSCTTENTTLPGAATFEPGPSCLWTETPLADDDEPTGDATAGEQMAALSGLVNTTLKWDHTGETTTLSTALTPTSAAWVTGQLVTADGEPVTSDTSDTGGGDCPPYMSIAGQLSLVTADERMAEALSVNVHSDTAGVGRVDTQVGLSDFGSDLPLGIDPDEWDTVTIEIAVNLSEGASGGELAVYAERVSDTTDESHGDDFARWPWDG